MGPLALPDAGPRAVAAAASAALAAELAYGGELAERELRPLAALPGWFAYRPPATVLADHRIEDTLVMRADLVARLLGYLPESPAILPE